MKVYWLRNWTQEEIGNKLGIARTSVLTKIKEIEHFFKELSENPELEIPTKYGFLSEKWQEMSEFQPLYYNHHIINLPFLRGFIEDKPKKEGYFYAEPIKLTNMKPVCCGSVIGNALSNIPYENRDRVVSLPQSQQNNTYLM